MNARQRHAINVFQNVDAAFNRIFTMTDIAATQVARDLGTLPIPASDIPAKHGRLIAENVALDLARIGYRNSP